MFLGEMSGVFARDLRAFGPSNSFAQISQNLGRRFVVLGAARIDELFGFAKPLLGRLDHLLHSILTFLFLLRGLAPRVGFALLFFFCVKLGAKGLSPLYQLAERAVQGHGWPVGSRIRLADRGKHFRFNDGGVFDKQLSQEPFGFTLTDRINPRVKTVSVIFLCRRSGRSLSGRDKEKLPETNVTILSLAISISR